VRQVDPDSAVFQDLGLALVLVQRLKAAALSHCQDGSHVGGLVVRLRVNVEVIRFLVHAQDDQAVWGAVLPTPPSQCVEVGKRALMRNILVGRDERPQPPQLPI
jgi:hypothetical protein